MKQTNRNFRMLRLIATKIDLDKFYSITFDDSSLRFQGKFDSELCKKLSRNKKWTKEISDGGFVEFRRGITNVTFT